MTCASGVGLDIDIERLHRAASEGPLDSILARARRVVHVELAVPRNRDVATNVVHEGELTAAEAASSAEAMKSGRP